MRLNIDQKEVDDAGKVHRLAPDSVQDFFDFADRSDADAVERQARAAAAHPTAPYANERRYANERQLLMSCR